ncbi:NAD(P)/FAD-dependent oxidoreductase [Microtetraspora malaysiensis]|uniref:NAD(P)/FAD-dependent oxidoreductase n=1 Tax=Microtetraspora malaysiensis TaxID=161358 RepID=UPI003D8FA4D6
MPGDRPPGVMNTGQLQNLVHLHHREVGTRAVIVGAELVSWSAALTLREAGCRTVLMTTEHPHAESYAAFSVPGRAVLRVPVATRTRVTRIIGHYAVEAVEVEDLATGARRTVPCDTVIFTGDWIPDHELARAAGLDIDPGSKGPLVDNALRTSRPGVFAVGNLVHPVDTADIAALDGHHVARHVRDYLAGVLPQGPGIPLRAEAPFTWVSPGLVRPGAGKPPRERILLWSAEQRLVARVEVTQDGRRIARRTLPGRSPRAGSSACRRRCCPAPTRTAAPSPSRWPERPGWALPTTGAGPARAARAGFSGHARDRAARAVRQPSTAIRAKPNSR